jgi:hypothetical protein
MTGLLLSGQFAVAIPLAIPLLDRLSALGIFGKKKSDAELQQELNFTTNKLRVYSQLSAILSSLLVDIVVDVMNKPVHETINVPQSTIDNLENIFEKEAWVIEQTTSQLWTKARVGIRVADHEGIKRRLDSSVLVELLADVRRCLETLRKDKMAK